MAVYSKLLLSAGGGIVSSMQQAEQEKNTATILIGLGGTGIDAIRTIKTQVYSRLKPDDPDAIVPRYEHIRFLGIDSAEKSRGSDEENRENFKAGSLMALDDTESFSISNANVKKAFSNVKALEMREELSWLRWEDIDAPDLSKAGAGGIRQVGRYMMMDKSKACMTRLEQEINAAKMGLIDPAINIHIFSGLSGGTGAGCFLDVCYMVRHITNKIGSATLFGYFFLPDVNLSVIPFSDTKTRAYIPKNGYASMQELDYCMQLQYNGGSFVQRYQDHVDVAWKEPPVDMCHLICATDASNNVIENAYDYAMNVTAEYLMDFLTFSTAKFGIQEQLSNFRAKVHAADGEKVIGSHLAYCVIGASCANIPLREINTYLASELFEKFSSIRRNLPGKSDVEALAISALARDAQSISEVYNSLYRELFEGFDESYLPYQDDWRFVRDYGNSQMVTSYTNQTASKLNIAEKNAKSMISAENKRSLMGRVEAQLETLIRRLDYGPMFAYCLISAAQSHNLLNVIDGLIQENTTKWDQELAQKSLRFGDYENAKSDFENRRKRSLMDNDSKRFNDYEYYLMLCEQHKLSLSCYQKMDEVLNTFRKQLEESSAAYYIRLNRVLDTLINTFKENRDAIASEKIMQAKGSFVMPMMTIADLKKTLDEEIEHINIPGMLDSFMRMMLEHSDIWLGEDENKIAKLVNEFFVKTAFNGFANRTITSFLKDKYGTTSDEQLANIIYNDWIKKLTQKASPLFYFNGSVWRENQTSKLAHLSFPESSAPISAAAKQMFDSDNMWVTKGSALTDRIFVMCSACALPLSAYNNCEDYERMCFSTSDPGRYYYEGKPVPGMPFNDWRLLPSLTPPSLIDINVIPYRMSEIVMSAQKLYEGASAYGIFDDENRICAPDESAVQTLRSLTEEAKALMARISKPADIAEAQELLEKLRAAKKLPLIPTKSAMKNDGYAAKMETKLGVQKDHFVAAPAYQAMVREILEVIKQADSAAEEAAGALEEKIKNIGDGSRALGDYCDGLFTGAISLEGRMLIYRRNDYGIVTEVVLSKRGDEFKYCAIPIYQGYVSYRTLLDDEAKADIKKRADDIYNADSPELKAAGEQLKNELSDNKVQAWVMSADSFEEKNEIIEFIMSVRKKFGAFCLENGI